nr:hypothetical protein MACL_00001833 [Theileria orientalis]
MGARQSYLYIYLKKKDKDYDEAGCKVKPTKSVVKGCLDFELVTYTIEYNGDSSYYDIYIYDTEDKDSDAYYIFGYCSPRTHQVANKVEGDVLPKLKEQYRKLNLNKTIELVDGAKETKDVEGFKQEIGDEKKNFRIVYIPNGKESVLNSNCLFSSDTKLDQNKHAEVKNGCKEHKANDKKNQIDSYYLTSVKGHFFDGIIVYFAREEVVNGKEPDTDNQKNTALYLEFINLRKKNVCFKRKDKAGCCWVEDKIDYNDDSQLSQELNKINEEIKQKDVNTVIIDEKKPYFGAQVQNEGNKQAYTQYTHTYTQEHKLYFIFGRKESEIPKINEDSPISNKVEVYYLKPKDAKVEDKEPFLVVIYKNSQKKENKAYHFKYGFGFKEWIEFEVKKKKAEKQTQEDLIKELEQKLAEIENNGSYKPQPAPVAPPPKKEKRPKLYVPDPTTEPVNLWLIIGCSIGGFLLIVALAIGYAIYWYNTTIKLLT